MAGILTAAAPARTVATVMRSRVASLLVAVILAGLGSSMAVGVTVACSPLADPPTLVDLGPGQVVVMGTTGERVEAGRLFHVERWFNGGAPTTPIIIAFQEGEAIGDCSYPMEAGRHLIIAPFRDGDGTLRADLVTLQADPDSDAGRAYLAEAAALYGPGVVPGAAEPGAAAPVDEGIPPAVLILAGLVVVGALAAAVFVIGDRRVPRSDR